MSAFDKVIGYKEIKDELIRVCDIMKNPQKYNKLGIKLPKGLVLYGAPGVGKTLLAKCMMEESGRAQFIFRKKQEDGDFMKTLNKMFEDAKQQAPSIILLDDIDKFGESSKNNSNDSEYVAVQSCIDDSKEDDIFIVATCNARSYLPESLVRAGRFDLQYKIDIPTGKECEQIVDYYLKHKKCASDVDTKEIAKMLDGASCAALESVVNQGGIYAGYAGKEEIEMCDMVEAVLGVLFNSPKSIKQNSKKEAEAFAIHEAGHTIVSEVLSPNSVHLVTIRKHIGDIGGFTFLNREEDYWIDINQMKQRVMSLLGGRVATELVYGRVDTGTGNDLERAEKVLQRWAMDYGAFGFNKVFHSYIDRPGGALQDRIDLAVANEMEKLYADVKQIVATNMDFLKAVANALIEKETLTAKDISEIKKSHKICK